MVLVNKAAEEIPETWSYPEDLVSPVVANQILSLSVMEKLDKKQSLIQPLGLYAPAGTVIDELLPYIHLVSVILIDFPKFRDGRGFTLARNLRQQANFQQDIRARGHLIPDQFPALLKCGFTSFLLPKEHPPEQLLAMLQNNTVEKKQPLLIRLLKK
ncbi:hypothetical protein AA0313_2014 [Acetobacter indonesiensis NRIC 0313]|uniref:Oxidoreductase n=1 Tax=Acetobacter indonesiensis TaxID=104101 RepID=A0A6N3T965_9PROT|nr:DUF934 domain-containing protein [Acetobacter indonesiensis]GAN61911.1 hypothetical protein Abin_003_028 [Acetobacter indonesiensis]GBQ59180.1 hypothetical protein AA0313_2014 [Acetobacter indonesiensis NRIC 0313]GEN04638.1 hypothetical protein AIN02nite_26630 [Acetobacter indonesiensis]